MRHLAPGLPAGVAAAVVGADGEGPVPAPLHSGYAQLQITDKQGPVTYGYGKTGAWALRGTRPSQDGGDLATARTTPPAYVFAFTFVHLPALTHAVLHYMGIQPAPPGGPVHEALVTYLWYTRARLVRGALRHHLDGLRSVTYTRSYWGPRPSSTPTKSAATSRSIRSGDFHPARGAHDLAFFRPDLHKWTVMPSSSRADRQPLPRAGPARRA